MSSAEDKSRTFGELQRLAVFYIKQLLFTRQSFSKMTMPFSERCGKRSSPKVTGQVLLLTTLTIGGILLGATTIAGLLMVYQIRQATDLANSGKSIFAADTGIEWGLYQFFNPNSSRPAPVLSNGASFTTSCSPATDCKNIGTRVIRSVGKSANGERALELNL